ncbi:GST N-terminal domain-containing protein [Plasmodiophora brassicae]
MMSPKLTLVSLDSTCGLTDAIRLCLFMGDVKYNDDRVSWDAFERMKEDLPFQEVPILKIDDEVLSTPGAIARFVARLVKFYPVEIAKDDMMSCACIDEIMEACVDLSRRIHMSMARRDQDDDERKRRACMREHLAKHVLPRWLNDIDQILERNEESGFAVGNCMTIADLFLYCMIQLLRHGDVDNVPKGLVERCENVHRHWKIMSKEPKIVEWTKNHPSKPM